MSGFTHSFTTPDGIGHTHHIVFSDVTQGKVGFSFIPVKLIHSSKKYQSGDVILDVIKITETPFKSVAARGPSLKQ